MERRSATVTKERDVRTHAELWHTSKCLLERGQEQQTACAHQFRASLVFTAFALEAYLNWLGQQRVAHWQYLERLKPKKKLEVVAATVCVQTDFSKRPWNIVAELFGFRNDIAHGKPKKPYAETTERVDEWLDGKLGELLRTPWELFCTEKNAIRARQDVSNIVHQLHRAAAFGSEESSDPFFFGLQVHGASISH